jgi:cytochrome b6-f complex iron-sulfur subunit
LAIAIVIVIIFVVAAVTIFLTASRRRTTTGTLSRETRSRDQSGEAATEPATSTSTEIEATGRTRADDTRENMPGDVAVRDGSDVVVWEPVDEEEIGVNRRQFLNRALLGVSGFSAGVLGIGILGFLWPTGSSGFGGKIDAGNIDDILGQISDKRTPFYVPLAKTYLNPYPKNALPAAKKVASYKPVLPATKKDSSPSTSGACTWGVACRGACLHSGSSAPATARSTTRSARSGTGPRRAVSTGSR